MNRVKERAISNRVNREYKAASPVTTRFEPSGRERELRVLEYEFPAVDWNDGQ